MSEQMRSFFILSNPRSGSSLLRIILESHPNITVPPESGFLQWWYNKYGDWNKDDSKNDLKLTEFSRDLLSSKKFETYNFDCGRFTMNVKQSLPETYSELISLVYITYGYQNYKDLKIWGDKNNYYIKHLDLIKELYPDTKYIHLVRDGRDVAVSYLNLQKLKTTSPYKPKLSTKINEIASEWNGNNLKIVNFLKGINSGNFLIVHYEDLVLNMMDTCRKISNFLDVNFSESMLNYHENNKEKSIEPKATLDWKLKTLKPPDPSAIGQYKMFLEPDEIETFNSHAYKCLQIFNYA